MLQQKMEQKILCLDILVVKRTHTHIYIYIRVYIYVYLHVTIAEQNMYVCIIIH